MNAWQVRNGDVGKGGDRFVTYGDLEQQFVGLLGGVFGATPGLATQPGTPGTGGGGIPNPFGVDPSRNGQVIRDLQESIFKSELFRRLGEQIARVEVPRAAVKFVQDAVRATSSQVESIGAQVGQNESAILAERNTRVDQTTAIASAVNTMWAIMSGGAFNSQVGSIIQDGSLAAVSPIAATAQRFNTLQSYVIGPNNENLVASVTQNFNTYVNSTNGYMESAYTLRVDIDNNGRRVVGGFGVLGYVNSPTAYPRIDFGVRADRFFIASPNPSNPALFDQTAPFIVLTTTDALGNPPGVYIDNAMIKFASITTARIANAAIDTLRIAGSAVTVSSYDSSIVYGSVASPYLLTTDRLEVCTINLTISGLASGEYAGTIATAYMTFYEQGGSAATVLQEIYVDGTLYAQAACTLGESKTLTHTAFAYLDNGPHTISLRVASGDGYTKYVVMYGTLTTMSGKR